MGISLTDIVCKIKVKPILVKGKPIEISLLGDDPPHIYTQCCLGWNTIKEFDFIRIINDAINPFVLIMG